MNDGEKVRRVRSLSIHDNDYANLEYVPKLK